MSDTIKQQISAFIDGELPDNESELLLRRMSQDEALRAQAAQFLTIGGAIRGDLVLPSMLALRQRLKLAIDAEPAVSDAQPAEQSHRNGFMRPVAGIAVAASVAVMALVGLRQVGSIDELPAPGVGGFDDRSAVAIDGGSLYTEPPVAEFMSDRPSDMLTQYYLSHGQQSANLGSRLVGLEVREDRLGAAPANDERQPVDGAIGPDSAPAADAPADQADPGSAQ